MQYYSAGMQHIWIASPTMMVNCMIIFNYVSSGVLIVLAFLLFDRETKFGRNRETGKKLITTISS